MISVSAAFHLLKMTHLAGAVWSCVSLVRGWWLCRPMGCDFNWIPAFSSHPQVKPVVLVLPDLGFFSSQPPPVYSSPVFHSLICCSACAPGYPLLPWLPYTGPLICAAVWSCGRWVPQCFMNLKSQNTIFDLPSFRSFTELSSSTAFFGHPVFSSLVLLSFISFQTGCVRLWGFWRTHTHTHALFLLTQCVMRVMLQTQANLF